MTERAIEFDPRAERDVSAAVEWYDHHHRELGDQFVEKLDALLQQIAEYPRSYRPLESDVRRAILKQFPYAIYYQFTDAAIRVIAVLHTSRRPDYWKDR